MSQRSVERLDAQVFNKTLTRNSIDRRVDLTDC